MNTESTNSYSTLLLNDTSDYHFGCKKVVESFVFDGSIKTNEYASADSVNYKKYDKVILNGEGTMHHSSSIGLTFLDALYRAQQFGCETELLNTVWQDMPNHKALAGCSRITVREPLSQSALHINNIDSEIVPDRCLMHSVEEQKYPHITIYRGQYFNSNNSHKHNDYPRINIFEQEWDEIVNRLRNSDLLITGRHHEMYASIKARCKFIVTKGNSWKNEGLIKPFGLSTSMIPDDVLSGKYDSQFNDLFDYCESTIQQYKETL